MARLRKRRRLMARAVGAASAFDAITRVITGVSTRVGAGRRAWAAPPVCLGAPVRNCLRPSARPEGYLNG